MSSAPVQLIVYEFEPGASFEGQLGGALQRLESGGTLRILDALFVQRDPDTGELVALEATGTGGGGITAPILEFRLDSAQRARATKRALEGPRGPRLLDLGSQLAPGAALAAVYVEHRWAEALDDAARRIGGSLISDEFVDADELARDLSG